MQRNRKTHRAVTLAPREAQAIRERAQVITNLVRQALKDGEQLLLI